MNWREKYKSKLVSANEAVQVVKSGDRIIVNLGGEPSHCLHALAKRADELRGVKIASSWSYDYPWFHPGLENSFDVGTTFTARATRLGIRERRISYIPWLPGLGERDRCLEQGRACVQQHADVAFVVVTPPDDQGYCSFGNQYWNGPNAVRTAKAVVAEVNEKIPFVFGENVPVSRIDYLVEAPEGSRPTTMPGTEWTTTNVEEWEKEQVIASIASDLVRDGDTLQVGIGTPSESILSYLHTKNDLGLDTEVIYPAAIDLIKSGNITGIRKNVNQGKVICTSAWIVEGHAGEKATIEFLDHNPLFEFHDFAYICNVPRIASNDNLVAVNTILGIDLMGQAIVDFLGPTPIAGQGGQLEYCIGSHYSRGGRTIACLLSYAKGGSVSRIVPQFEAGTGIGVPMYYVDYLVTEYGMVNLEYKNWRERAEAIISVAHPNFRDELSKAAKKLFWP